ncbi:hypothetical protein CUMW_211080, partial [Citrus unshiu]
LLQHTTFSHAPQFSLLTAPYEWRALVVMNLQIDLNTNLDECGNVIDGNMNLEPYIGLVFDTQDDAYSFYLRYAKCMGFGISKKSSRRSKLSGEFIDTKFTCTKYGIKRESSAINQ